MKLSQVFSFAKGVTDTVKGEKYGETIAEEIEKGKQLEEAIRTAYNKHGVIPEQKLSFSVFTKPLFVTVMGGYLSGLHGMKLGFFNQKLWSALVRVSRQMSEAGENPSKKK